MTRTLAAGFRTPPFGSAQDVTSLTLKMSNAYARSSMMSPGPLASSTRSGTRRWDLPSLNGQPSGISASPTHRQYRCRDERELADCFATTSIVSSLAFRRLAWRPRNDATRPAWRQASRSRSRTSRGIRGPLSLLPPQCQHRDRGSRLLWSHWSLSSVLPNVLDRLCEQKGGRGAASLPCRAAWAGAGGKVRIGRLRLRGLAGPRVVEVEILEVGG